MKDQTKAGQGRKRIRLRKRWLVLALSLIHI